LACEQTNQKKAVVAEGWNLQPAVKQGKSDKLLIIKNPEFVIII